MVSTGDGKHLRFHGESRATKGNFSAEITEMQWYITECDFFIRSFISVVYLQLVIARIGVCVLMLVLRNVKLA